MTEKTPESLSSDSSIVVQDGKKKTHFIDYLKLFIALIVFVAGLWVYNTNIFNAALSSFKYVILIVSGVVSLLLILFWCQFGRDFRIYVIDSVAEFKKVVWLPKSESIKITLRVIIFSLILAIFIYCIDSLISIIFNSLLLKG